MGEFCINGRSVTQEEWEAYLHAQSSSVPIFEADGDTTGQDICISSPIPKAPDEGNNIPRHCTAFGTTSDILQKHCVKPKEPSMWDNRDFVFDMVRQDWRNLEHASDELKKDRDIVLAALLQDEQAITLADDSLKRDKDLIRAAILNEKSTGLILQWVDRSVLCDRDFMLELAKDTTSATGKADGSLSNNKSYVLDCIKNYRRLHGFFSNTPPPSWSINESLAKDRDIAFARLAQTHTQYDWLDPSLKDDPDFMFNAALKANIHVFASWNGESSNVQKKAWEKFREHFKAELIETGLDAYSADFNSFKKGLNELFGIAHPNRFRSANVLMSVLLNRKKGFQANHGLETAIIISTKFDPNYALESYPLIDRLSELGYDIKYYENETEQEVSANLSDATSNGQIKADVIAFDGHGQKGMLGLAEGSLEASTGRILDEKKMIDISDFKEGRMDIDIASNLSPKGDVLDIACLNGEDGTSEPNNLANTFAGQLPRDARVHASTHSMNIRWIDRDNNGRIRAEWTSSAGNSLYVVNGSREERPPSMWRLKAQR